MSSIRNFFNWFTKPVDRHFLTSVDLEFLNSVKNFDAEINSILKEMKTLTNDMSFPQDPSFTNHYTYHLLKLEEISAKQAKDIFDLMEKKSNCTEFEKMTSNDY